MGTHPIFESDFDCLTELNVFAMETRQRSLRSENDYVKKSVKSTTARTTLGMMDKNSTEVTESAGPTKPMVRTTRAQELRKKALEAKKAAEKPKMVKQAKIQIPKKEETPKEEPKEE